jgi:ribosomal protein L11 methylase PrmA
VESVEAAREACRRTAAVNGVHLELRAAIPAEPFGLVVANMAVTSLLELGPQFRRAVAPGGALIVSGTRSEQLPEVLAALGISTAQGTQLDAGEWSAFLL